MGNLLSVVVHAADLHDTKVGIWAAMFAYVVYPSIRKFNADGGYRKTFIEKVKKYIGGEVKISGKIEKHEFKVISPRWG